LTKRTSNPQDMKSIKSNIRYLALYVVVALFMACQQPGVNSTGSEYMPDMGHSIAYEANHYNYYYQNTWGTEDEYYSYAKPREPVSGTIARGNAGGVAPTESSIAFAPNGAVPYYYGDNDAERERAIAEVINNPYPITESGLAVGKDLYTIFCGICHGAKGDGAGHLARDGSPYPVIPANMLLPEFISSSNGRYYHAIYYGKNKMGAYKDKLSYEERWQVIHYIRSLQAKELKVEYNQVLNTLNDIDRPAGVKAEEVVMVDEGGHSHTDGTEHDNHDDDHGHDDGHGHDDDHSHDDDH